MREAQLAVDVLITVKVDVSAGTVVLPDPPPHASPGQRVAWELQLVNNPGTAKVKGYLEIPDQEVLEPEPGTGGQGFQSVVFPFQTDANEPLRPTFHVVTDCEEEQEDAVITVLFPNSDHPSAAVTSVVIIDM